jgi:hypothetical protein
LILALDSKVSAFCGKFYLVCMDLLRGVL